MKTITKALSALLVAAFILSAVGCQAPDAADDSGQANETFLTPILSNDKATVTGFLVEIVSEESIHDNLTLTDNVVYFTWLDFVTAEQLEIAREFLNIPEGVFDDNALLVYVHLMDKDSLQHYDSIPFEDMPTDPQRIIVRMYEAWILMHMNIRKQSSIELGLPEPSFFSHVFGRKITDWR